MASKNISISLDHTFESGRGETETVREALTWIAEHMSDEEGNVPFTPADLIVYGVRRLRALHKDGKRYGSGKLAARLYSPRLDNLSDKVRPPKKLAAAVETIHEVASEAHKPAPKKAPRKSATPVKPEPVKAAPPVKASAPVVRKHAAK